MFWKVALGIFVAVGMVVAILSIYRASVDGVMGQMGLVSSDFQSAVVQDKLSEVISSTRNTIKCDLPARLKGTVSFMLSGDEEQGQLAFRLGEARINCGAQMLVDGQVEDGTYEVVKGIGYLKQGYTFVGERAGVDRRVCEGLPGNDVDIAMMGILEATSGRVYEVIWNGWQDVVKMREPLGEVCLDQRNSTR